MRRSTLFCNSIREKRNSYSENRFKERNQLKATPSKICEVQAKREILYGERISTPHIWKIQCKSSRIGYFQRCYPHDETKNGLGPRIVNILEEKSEESCLGEDGDNDFVCRWKKSLTVYK